MQHGRPEQITNKHGAGVTVLESLTEEQVEVIVALTAKQVSQDSIARVAGVSVETVQLVLNQPQVVMALSAKSAETVGADLGIDDKWDRLESGALDGILADIQTNSAVFEPFQMLSLASQANKARRRHGAVQGKNGILGGGMAHGSTNVVVQLSLPTVMVQNLKARVIEHEESQKLKEFAGSSFNEKLEIAKRAKARAESFERFQGADLSTGDIETVLGVDLTKLQDEANQELDANFALEFEGTGLIATEDTDE